VCIVELQNCSACGGNTAHRKCGSKGNIQLFDVKIQSRQIKKMTQQLPAVQNNFNRLHYLKSGPILGGHRNHAIKPNQRNSSTHPCSNWSNTRRTSSPFRKRTAHPHDSVAIRSGLVRWKKHFRF
jgi:hypothetical protein